METLFSTIMDFRMDFRIPLDNLAAYHGDDDNLLNEKLRQKCAQASACYNQYIRTNRRDGDGLRRLTETKVIIFAED